MMLAICRNCITFKAIVIFSYRILACLIDHQFIAIIMLQAASKGKGKKKAPSPEVCQLLSFLNLSLMIKF